MNHWELYGNGDLLATLNAQQSFDFDFVEKKQGNSIPVVIKKIPELNSVLPTRIWPVGELSEIRCKKNVKLFHLLLPLLSKLNDEKRWITLIAPPMDIDKKLFAYHGIDVSRVLLIHPNEAIDDTITMNKALKNGTSGMVILWADKIKKRFVAQWRKSVKQGNCRGIIVNHDTVDHGSNSVALTLNVKSSRKSITITSTKKFGKLFRDSGGKSYPILDICNRDNELASDKLFHLTN